jgi:hypothetical protein
MNPYTILSSGLGTHEAAGFSNRLSAWHDAMVAHERRRRAGTTSDACGDECPHAEARSLWAEAVATFGARAQELAFLRSRAQEPRPSVSSAAPTSARAEAAERSRRRVRQSVAEPPSPLSSAVRATAATEV